jgi:hypothetical protein
MPPLTKARKQRLRALVLARKARQRKAPSSNLPAEPAIETLPDEVKATSLEVTTMTSVTNQHALPEVVSQLRYRERITKFAQLTEKIVDDEDEDFHRNSIVFLVDDDDADVLGEKEQAAEVLQGEVQKEQAHEVHQDEVQEETVVLKTPLPVLNLELHC